MPPKRKGWIGVDFDGTLAVYERWLGVHHVGAPIPEMVERVKRWEADGWEVRILTARVAVSATKPLRETDDAKKAIDAWCLEVFGHTFVLTCRKDAAMIELWDDRAVAVERNTGRQLTRSEVDGEPA